MEKEEKQRQAADLKQAAAAWSQLTKPQAEEALFLRGFDAAFDR